MMIRFYMTSFDRSLMDHDSINNVVDHMILLHYVLKMRVTFQTEISINNHHGAVPNCPIIS
jgi:hypothetical protein